MCVCKRDATYWYASYNVCVDSQNTTLAKSVPPALCVRVRERVTRRIGMCGIPWDMTHRIPHQQTTPAKPYGTSKFIQHQQTHTTPANPLPPAICVCVCERERRLTGDYASKRGAPSGVCVCLGCVCVFKVCVCLRCVCVFKVCVCV